MKQRRRNRGVIELKVGEDRRDFERVRNIRVARGSLLLAMGAHGVDISAVKQILVGVRIVVFDAIDQFILPHQPLARLCRQRLDLKRRQIEAARHRRPDSGLVLHPRQIDRHARHCDTSAALLAALGHRKSPE